MSKASEHRLYFLLQQVSHKLKKRVDQLAIDSGSMTTAQAAVLNIIIAEGSASQAFIAKQLSQRESATMTMVSRLQKANYITKERSEDDRRTWVLKPTRKGRSTFNKMNKVREEVNALLDDAVPAKKMDDLVISLNAVLSALDEPNA